MSDYDFMPSADTAAIDFRPHRHFGKASNVAAIIVFVALLTSQPVLAKSSHLPAREAPTGCEWRAARPGANDKWALYCVSYGEWQPALVRSDFGPDTIADARVHKADALAALGEYYLFGPTNIHDVALTDPVKALGLFREAADGGNTSAMRFLGMMYTGGWPQALQRDADESMRWYRKAADQGDGDAMTRIALMYETVGSGVQLDYGQALSWYQRAAAAGSPSGMDGLATMYYSGRGAPADGAKALQWYRAAANAGYAHSRYMLGNMYLLGQGVPKDPTEGLRWLQMGADEEDTSAMLFLCQVYTHGWGVPKDADEANTRCTKYRKFVAAKNHVPESQISTAPIPVASPHR